MHQLSCIVEFDGASKGNPGQAGAGAILRTEDGRIVCIYLPCLFDDFLSLHIMSHMY